MKFGPVPAANTEGAILAHGLTLQSRRLKKGHVLTRGDIELVLAEGITSLIVAQLDHEDLDENEAAARLAAAMSGSDIEAETAGTGRVNLFARHPGLFYADRTSIAKLNQINAAITVATLADMTSVPAGRMVATVKIIPFAVNAHLVETAAKLGSGSNLIGVHAYLPKRVGLIATQLPHLKSVTMDKTRQALEQRLEKARAYIGEELRVPHNANAIAEAIDRLRTDNDLLVIFGASAIVDKRDVVPCGLELAGGGVEHLGMPVDPGNLLMLGNLGGKPVIGAPSCARSPRENGFDWVLNRLLADIDVGANDLTQMGVGGLLMEIQSRPSPRQSSPPKDVRVNAIVLAAGLSRRMGETNKLLVEIDGKAMAEYVVNAANASEAHNIQIVTGHEADKIETHFGDRVSGYIHNGKFASGLASSVKAGIAGMPQECDGALVLLGDMPLVTAAQINQLIEMFQMHKGEAIVLATHRGKRGNPVIWPKRYFGEIANLTGDEGARGLIKSHPDAVVEVEIGEASSTDYDVEEDFGD